ncbi:hypothetical protein FGO68_gene16952 [Halteria grandinella]|uniref:Uncharacterized protein n=1 Tax=Halteria grandinella TaxID=5974 RepID=A0A8J8NX11_HALGN|nr:hypothetical protein FGO68_gene16952 [Halteria grandinella]
MPIGLSVFELLFSQVQVAISKENQFILNRLSPYNLSFLSSAELIKGVRSILLWQCKQRRVPLLFLRISYKISSKVELQFRTVSLVNCRFSTYKV